MDTLYISDLDGTLLNGQAEFSEETVNGLNELLCLGAQISFATARTAATVTKMMEGLSVKLPVILMNGALIYDLHQEHYVNTVYIPPEAVAGICRVLQSYHLSGFCYTVEEDQMMAYYDQLKTPAMREFYEERKSKYQKKFTQVASFEQVNSEKAVYFSFLNTEEILAPVYKELQNIKGISIEYYRDIYKTDQWYLEILSSAASKRQGAAFLKQYTGAQRLVGFGDNLNDLPLFESCDEAYAVANAHPDVKARATAIIGSNMDNGVVTFLKQELLKKGGSK